ncbi:MAG: hypothetical protein DMF79_15670, partial [Acidobacteria bacterium]
MGGPVAQRRPVRRPPRAVDAGDHRSRGRPAHGAAGARAGVALRPRPHPDRARRRGGGGLRAAPQEGPPGGEGLGGRLQQRRLRLRALAPRSRRGRLRGGRGDGLLRQAGSLRARGRGADPRQGAPADGRRRTVKSDLDRRGFLGAVVAGAATLAGRHAPPPAILGGTPVRREPFPSWPVADVLEERSLVDVVKSGEWFRVGGRHVDRFESAYAELMGSKHCLATANGTSALLTSLHALGVGPGDEVILPPYTFVATVNVVLLLHALPVFVDTDLETFQIDAGKVEAAVTERTRVLLPVHLGGSSADLDTLLAVSSRRGVPLIEDACQAHLAEWRGRRVGTHGRAGCFSFQASKNLNSGEGGAILTDDPEL